MPLVRCLSQCLALVCLAVVSCVWPSVSFSQGTSPELALPPMDIASENSVEDDSTPSSVWKYAGTPKKSPDLEASSMEWQNQEGNMVWQLLQHNPESRSSAFVWGSWEFMTSGKMKLADFAPVSPSEIKAALGLATVYREDSAGWFVSVGERLSLRTTSEKLDRASFSYESFARLAWAVGVTKDARVSARILYDSGYQYPLDFNAMLYRAVREAPHADAWIVSGMADLGLMRGQSLRRSPAAGEPMTETYDPEQEDRFFFSPIEKNDTSVLFAALVVKKNADSTTARELSQRFFSEKELSRQDQPFLVRIHCAEFYDNEPIYDPSIPVSEMWDSVRNDNDLHTPKVSSVRELLEGSTARRSHFNVFAIDEVVEYDLYETPVLVDVEKLDPTILTEQYWTTNTTFVGEVLYERPRFLLRPEVAEAIMRINQRLRDRGMRLKLFDAYRPLSITQKLYHKLPGTPYLAVPNRGSRHNRGAAVDCTITDMQGNELEMQSPYLRMGEEARRDYDNVSEAAEKNREFLTRVMAREGFTTILSEWWHYDAPNWQKYPVMDVPLWPSYEDRGHVALVANDPTDVGTRMLRNADVAVPERFKTGAEGLREMRGLDHSGDFERDDRQERSIELKSRPSSRTRSSEYEKRYAQMFETGLPEDTKDADSNNDGENDDFQLPEVIDQLLEPEETQAPATDELEDTSVEEIPPEDVLIPAEFSQDYVRDLKRSAEKPEEKWINNPVRRWLRRLLPAALADALWNYKWYIVLMICVLFSGVMYLRSRR